MKIVILTFFFAFTWVTGFAQYIREVDRLKQELAITKQDTSRVLVMAELSNTYRLSKPDSAMKYGKQALSKAQQIKFIKGESKALNSIGVVYRELGDLPKALDFALKALRISQVHQYIEVMGECNSTLGIIYYDLNDFSKALLYYNEAKTFAEKSNNQQDLLGLYGYIGFAYLRINQLDSALHYIQLAYTGAIQAKNAERLSVIFRNLGRIQIKLGNNRLAFDYFNQSIQVAIRNDDQRNASYTYNDIAKLYQKINQTDSCIFYAKKGLAKAQLGPFNIRILEATTLLAGAYKTKNDFKQAYEYQALMIKAKESLYGAGNIQAMQTMIADDQERQREIEAEKVAYQNQIKQYALLIGLGVFLLIAFILYRNNWQKQQANAILEKTLANLRTTQAQLIQKEKMASLGELTAGIAHEIQNPLNFVNNFSEVSTELIEELKEEAQAGHPQDVLAIADDLTQNLQKITHHGSRASAIVKGMLEHSRTDTGERQLTNLNTLADEYLRLAYQGFRSKNNTFNASLVTDFATILPQVEVVPQEIGRVLLNLFTNAFYTVSEKKKHQPTGYEPTVSISTRRLPNQIEIRVKDNGLGIPELIKDKIFQPFFTTKPTGEGTGLGLSLSYDIVAKGHGGTLTVESKEGEMTEFIVNLPA